MSKGPTYEQIMTAYEGSAARARDILKAVAFARGVPDEVRGECVHVVFALEDALQLAAGKTRKTPAP